MSTQLKIKNNKISGVEKKHVEIDKVNLLIFKGLS